MIFRDADLKIKNFFKKDVELQQKGDSFYIRYYALARQALLEAVSSLGIQKGDSILVPAYICEEAVSSIRKSGIEIKYYSINEDFSTNFGELNGLIDSQTKAVIWVNYFGLKENVEMCRDFCNKHRLYLIEDNAHTLVLNLDYIQGDAAIFSLRKFYPSPDGAMLVFKKDKAEVKEGDYFPINSIWTLEDYKFITGKVLRRGYSLFSNTYFNKILLNYKNDRKNAEPGGEENNSLMVSRSSLQILRSLTFDEIFHHRRFNFRMLKDHLFVDNQKIKVLFDELTDNYCPLAFPILVKEKRDEFIKGLFLEGFVAYGWPDLPKEVLNNSNFNIENELAKRVVLLPIHQSMSEKNIIELAEAINKVSDEISAKV